MNATPMVLSPHLDDAVLSAAVQLMRPGAELVTVFAGAPSADHRPSGWDRLTRARSPLERHRERLAEDDAARAVLGCRSRRLNEPEAELRVAELDVGRLADRLKALVSDAEELWVPAGIGGHPDHLALREAALLATEDRADLPIHLYADLPYAIWYGWPTWATGEPVAEFLDPDSWLQDELAGQGLIPASLAAVVVPLSPLVRERKARAVRAYRSQLPAIGLDPQDMRRWDEFLRYELFWNPKR